MHRVLIVSYDLSPPGQNYESLIQRIKSYPGWARLGGSAYLILTESPPETVRNHLASNLDSNDKLYVGVSPAPSAWTGMPTEVGNWIIENQK